MARDPRPVLADGLIAGFLGYLVIMMLVTIGDVLRGQPPFHTAALLGSALFYAGVETAALAPWPGPVLAFNGAHLVVMLAFGMLLAWLAGIAESSGPQAWYISVVVLLFVLLHGIGLPLWLPTAGVSPWVVTLATGAAVAVMILYLWRTHPLLRKALRSEPE